MMHLKRCLFVACALIVSTLPLAACAGGGRPPHYGAYLRDGRDLVELAEMTAYSVPRSSSLEDVPTIRDSRPVVILWKPDTRLQYLQLFSASSGRELRYIADPKDEGIVELQPADVLEPGGYCYLQGDPLGLGLPAWCFEVEGTGSASPVRGASMTSLASWIPLATAGALLVATGGTVLTLGLTGRLKKWGSAGLSAGKWRVEAIKLGRDLNRLEKDKTKLLSELGAKAWQARVEHPDYEELYARLEALDQQSSTLSEQTQAAEQQLVQAQKSRSQTETDYGTRIKRVQEELQGATKHLSQARADHAELERRLDKSQTDRQKTEAEIQTLRARLEEAQTSEAPDQEVQTASLSNAIAALEKSLVRLDSEIPLTQSEIARLEIERQPLPDEVDQLEQTLGQVEAEQREALAPLDRLIADLQSELQKNQEQAVAISQQMASLTDELGPRVDRARPESPALAELYGRLDRLYQELADLSQQRDLLQVRLDTVDTGALRGFYGVVGGLAVALILIVVLLIVALA